MRRVNPNRGWILVLLLLVEVSTLVAAGRGLVDDARSGFVARAPRQEPAALRARRGSADPADAARGTETRAPREDRGARRPRPRASRRAVVSSLVCAAVAGGPPFVPAAPALADSAATTAESEPPRRIVRLSSGVQFSDARVGGGAVVQPIQTDADEVDAETEGVVLLHLRALRRDGSLLFDTRDEGRPLLLPLGSLRADGFFLTGGSAVARGRVPLGVEDAILAQGAASWEGGFGRADPMRSGGIRMVVVPAELAYGNGGVSRYEAMRLGFKSPVARDETLRYEIELLRCNDDVLEMKDKADGKQDDDGTARDDDAEGPPPPVTARACCPEEFYPCKTSPSS